MISPDINADGYTGQIIIEPNRSLSWQDNVRFIKWFSLLSLIIALYFMYFGFILVLPFSGLEVVLVSIALYIVYRRYSIRQVIHFTEDSVIIESGRTQVDIRVEYQRHWSKFHVEEQNNSLPRLTIQSRGESTEIGDFLNIDDKHMLISLIKDITLQFKTQHRSLDTFKSD